MTSMERTPPKTLDAAALSRMREEALQCAGIGVYRMQLDGSMLFMDRGAFNILDLAGTYPGPDQVAGRHVSELFESGGLDEPLHQIVRTRGPVAQLEQQVWTRAGRRKWLLHDAYLVHDDQLGAEVVQGAIHDVTGRKQVENALQESKSRSRFLADVIERSSQPFACGTSDGMLLHCNPAFSDLTGYDRGRLEGLNWRTGLTAPEHRPGLEQVIEEMQRNGTPQRFELAFLRRSGEAVPVEVFMHGIAGAEGRAQLYYLFATDISERKEAEKALRAQEAQLRHAQKMEAVGRLAGGVAHDFNNLLTAIIGTTELLLEQPEEGEALDEALEDVLDAARRGADLTRQLLAFSRRQVLHVRVMDLNETVRNTEKMLRRLIGEDIGLSTQYAGKPLRIKADPGQVEQVVMNLAVNARDAMPRGGTLELTTRRVALDKERVVGPVRVPPGAYAALDVADSGCGMNEDVKQHLFEPFFTTKDRGKGTGLGLATVYGIVTQLGGCITVESEVDRGTTFRAYLPLTTESPSASQAPPSAAGKRGNETVLVVEDAAPVRLLIRRALLNYGYQVLEAEDGAAALELAAQHEGPIHLLLTDIVMPKVRGPELAERITTHYPGIKVLFMTGYTDHELTADARLAPDVTYLEKPFTPSTLTLRMRQLLDG